MSQLDLDVLVKLGTIISAVATAMSAIYLKRQNQLAKKRTTISILDNPISWDSRQKTKITLCNSSNYPVSVDSYIVSNELVRHKGELHEYAVELSGDDCPRYLKESEVYVLELNTPSYPKNIPLSLEIRYKSSEDEFTQLRTLHVKGNRTVT